MIWVIDDHKSWSRSSTARVKTTASCRRRQLELLAHLPAIFLAKNYNFIGNILLIDRPTKLLKISQSCYGEHFISDNKAAKKCFKSRVFGNVKGVLSFEIWSVLLYREYFFLYSMQPSTYLFRGSPREYSWASFVLTLRKWNPRLYSLFQWYVCRWYFAPQLSTRQWSLISNSSWFTLYVQLVQAVAVKGVWS